MLEKQMVVVFGRKIYFLAKNIEENDKNLINFGSFLEAGAFDHRHGIYIIFDLLIYIFQTFLLIILKCFNIL